MKKKLVKMSRHRDFHNMDHDDYDDEPDYGSSVSGSYTDEMPLSRSMENDFMFRRGGNTPKMSQFFGRTNSVSSGKFGNKQLLSVHTTCTNI